MIFKSITTTVYIYAELGKAIKFSCVVPGCLWSLITSSYLLIKLLTNPYMYNYIYEIFYYAPILVIMYFLFVIYYCCVSAMLYTDFPTE